MGNVLFSPRKMGYLNIRYLCKQNINIYIYIYMQILNCSIFGNFKYLFEQFKIKIELTPNFKGPKVQFILITN